MFLTNEEVTDTEEFSTVNHIVKNREVLTVGLHDDTGPAAGQTTKDLSLGGATPVVWATS